MGFRRLSYRLSGSASIGWRLNRRLLIWLGLFVLVGAILGFVMVFNSKVSADKMSTSLIDGNILRIVRPTTSIGGLILGRLLDFVIFFGIIFVVCLHRWTVFFVFLLAGYRGFSMVVNLYWSLAKFSVISGVALFLVYLILFLILLIIFLAAIVFCLRATAEVRRGGWRGGIRWQDFTKGGIVLLCIIIGFALLEWALYWLILSKIMFVI